MAIGPSARQGRVLLLLLMTASPWAAPAATPQEATSSELPVSLDRIREAIERTPERRLDLDFSVPIAPRFRTRVEQRTYMLTFEEYLHKEFELTALQRQSQEWASRCCGLDLDALFKPLDRAWQRRKERRIRARIARELAEVQSATEQK